MEETAVYVAEGCGLSSRFHYGGMCTTEIFRRKEAALSPTQERIIRDGPSGPFLIVAVRQLADCRSTGSFISEVFHIRARTYSGGNRSHMFP
jgi:hypothetical protein